MTTEPAVKLNLRNAELPDLAAFLQVQHDHKHDGVVPATAVRSIDGVIYVDGMGMDGPAGGPGKFRPTAIMDGHFAERLGVPPTYLRKLRDERIDVYDATINALIHGGSTFAYEQDGGKQFPELDRNWFVRTFADPSGGTGIGRALLSDRFGAYDNFDMLLSLLDGIRATGEEVDVLSADLSERRMVVKLVAPKLTVMAPTLLENYRDPFDGVSAERARQMEAHGYLHPDERPIVFAGLVATNSETGGGAWTIGPRFMVKICRNGLIITEDVLRAVHLGGKMDVGVVKWSEDTQRKNLELVAAKTRDAVAQYLNVDYVAAKVAKLEEAAGKPIGNPIKTVELVSNQLSFTSEQAEGILSHFIKGGQITAGGVMQAVTSFAQTVEDADTAYDLEVKAVQAMTVAAKAQKELIAV